MTGVKKNFLKLTLDKSHFITERQEIFMSKIGIFMADGCEEIEGLTVVDVVRRAKMEIVMLSITGKKEVTSSHGVTF